MSPYEYFNDKLGVQSRFLYKGKGEAPDSLRLIGERGLRHRLKNEQIIRLRHQGPNSPALVLFDSLPADWRNQLIEIFGEPKEQARESLFKKHYKRDTQAYDYYLKYKKPDETYLDDIKVEEYTLNASVLNLINEIKAKRRAFRKELKGSTLNVWDTLVRDCTNFKREVPHTLPEKSRPLYNKLRKYNNEGYDSLIHKGVCNTNRKKVDSRIEQFLNDMFSEQADKPTATDVAKQYEGFLNGYVTVVNSETGEIYDPKEFPKLSNSTIKNYLSEWRNQIATHTRRSGNRQALMAKFKPYHSLIQPQFANSIISIDDRQPPFEYSKGKRMWFYNGIDLGSEAFTVWVHGESKEGIIIHFYRQLVRNYTEWGLNIPAEIECEMSLNSSFRDTFLKEGAMFEYVRIEANNARGKRIEAYYRQLRYELEKERMGWLARPFALSEANQPGSNKVPIIPYNEIVQGSLHDIEAWNNMEHSKIKGKSRWEVFMATQNPDVRPTNWRGILPYLGFKTQTSCHAGIVKLQGNEFLLGENGLISYSDELIRFMNNVEGKDLDIYWLDDNEGKVMKALVYIRDTSTYICELIAKPGYQKARKEQKPIDLANREAMSKYVATVEGYQRSRVKGINPISVIDETPTTISNTFKINGIHRNERPETENVEEMPDVDDADTYDYENMESSFNKSLKDRF